MNKSKIMRLLFFVLLIALVSCNNPKPAQLKISDIASVAEGWKGEIIATSAESYVGWDVEIGDADNDSKNEILCTGCPSSQLNMYKLVDDKWQISLLAENLAQTFPGMGLAVKVVDLDKDGVNEIILGTGQEGAGTAFYYTFRLNGLDLKTLCVSRPDCNKSGYTHNLAPFDLDNDGKDEVISAYCGGGEIILYDYGKSLEEVSACKLYQLSGSGEESIIADVDNDGAVEYITSNSFRKGKAKVEIFEFDSNGELVTPPRITIDGYDGNSCFYGSLMVGDVDNDGKNELIIGWKKDQQVNKGTILGYRVSDEVKKVYTFATDDPALDMSYFEKMMAIADADNDGRNELLVSTRGDNMSENIKSEHLGHLFEWKVEDNEIDRKLLLDFNEETAGSSWLAVGDADNDGKNEIVLASGKGDRTKRGRSYVVLIQKSE